MTSFPDRKSASQLWTKTASMRFCSLFGWDCTQGPLTCRATIPRANCTASTGPPPAELLDMTNKIDKWDSGIQKAERRASVEHAIRIGSEVLEERTKMDGSSNWPDAYLGDCDKLLALVREQITRELADWIPRQNCHSFAQVTEFRQRTEREVRGLARLGFRKEGEALSQQAQQSIYKVEKQQQFSLTLAQCDDYPRQQLPKAFYGDVTGLP